MSSSLVDNDPIITIMDEKIDGDLPDESVPEINRLENFIKCLEDELNSSNIQMDVPPDLSKEREDEPSPAPSLDINEEDFKLPVDLLTPFEDADSSSFDQLFGSPIKNPASAFENELGIPLLQTPSGKVDEFLIALEKAGYVQPSQHEPRSPERKSSSRFFFSSAMEESPERRMKDTTEDYDHLVPSPLFPFPAMSSSDQEHMIQKLNSMIINEEFTAESLKKNWDMEEEYEDELTDKLETISKVIEEKKKHSMSNLYTSMDEDITHYGSLGNVTPSSESASDQNTSGRNSSNLVEKINSEESLSFDVNRSQSNDVEDPNNSSAIVDLSTILPKKEVTEDLEAAEKENNHPLVQSSEKKNPTSLIRSSSFTPISKSNRERASSSPKKQSQQESNPTKDGRLNGDFIIWSSGKMLNADYTSENYVGLYENEITHYIDSGKLILLNKLSSKLTLAIASGSSTYQQSSHHHQHQNHPVLSQQGFQQGFQDFTENILLQTATTFDPNNPRGFYPIQVMETVIRPDIELKFFMSLIIKIAKKFNLKCNPLQRNHMVVTPTPSRNNPLKNLISGTLSSSSSSHHQNNQDTNNNNESDQQQNKQEFDQIDIQIVISRELRQRVLLIQFLKRVPFLNNNSLGSMLMSQIVGPYEYIPLSRCPKIRKFMSSVKLEMVSQSISLSALYNAPLKTVCALPQGLDLHFLAQLHSLCRDLMWQKLILEYKEMEDHVEVQQQDALQLLKLLESMFKQYNMKNPDPWMKKRRKSTTFLKYQKTTEAFTSPQKSPSSSSSHPTSHEKATNGSPNNNNSNIISPIPTNKSEQNVLFSPDIVNKSAPVAPIDTSSSNNNVHNSSHSNLSTLLHPIPTTPHSPLTSPNALNTITPFQDRNNRYIQDLLSAPKVDGMSFCLIMIDKCYYELQRRCDEEYARKIQQRHELTLQYTQDIATYKKELFYHFLENKEYKNSSLFKTLQGFNGTIVDEFTIHVVSSPPSTSTSTTTSQKKDPEPAGNQKKSWFQGLTSSIQQISTTITTNTSSIISSSNSQSSAATSYLLSSSSLVPGITIDETMVILYYCSCLVNSVPGFLYLTSTHVFVTSSILGLNQKKEVYSLGLLQDLILLNEVNELPSSSSHPISSASQKPAAADSQKISSATPAASAATATAPATTTAGQGGLKESIQSSAANLMNVNAMKLLFSSETFLKVKPSAPTPQQQVIRKKASQPITKEVLISPLTMDCSKLKIVIQEIKKSFE